MAEERIALNRAAADTGEREDRRLDQNAAATDS
jgi:hypothetical protein